MPPPALLPSAALAVSGPSHANASAFINVNTGPFGSVSGLISAQGSATAVGPGATAYAHSSAAYVLGGLGWRRGFVQWAPSMATSVGGVASAANPTQTRDPIAFEINGPSGGVIESGSFLNVELNFEGAASVSWTGTTMTIAPNATTLLDIRLGDANNAVANYVPDSSEGTLRLRLVNGTVVESSKSGAGAWLADWSLPAVGSTFSGDLATSNGFEFGWDFGRDVDANIKLDMGGMTAVPEPEEWAALAAAGLVGFAVWRRRAR
jgi:MYXO-CTERM domain-containing protein